MRHVRTEGGVRAYHEPIGAPIVAHPHIRDEEAFRAAGKAALAERKTAASHQLASSRAVRSAMEDRARTEASIQTQRRAQVRAENWYNRIGNDWNASDKDVEAANFWMDYQVPDEYGQINGVLRGRSDTQALQDKIRREQLYGYDPEAGRSSPSRAELKATANTMFKEAGTKTTEPIALYRALRSQDMNWSQQLTPGSTFKDRGMVSTTANPDFAQGWLMLDGTASGETHLPKPNDVVMEIRVPPGKTVVGGTTQFIETMLPPDSTFKIVSSEIRTAKARSPLDTHQLPTEFPYTHVIAELQ